MSNPMAVGFQRIFRVSLCEPAVGCFVKTALYMYELLHHVNYH